MELLIRILIAIGIVWLVQTVLGAFELKDPANKVIFVVSLILVILWLVTGQSLLR